jgi:hypothetical protein
MAEAQVDQETLVETEEQVSTDENEVVVEEQQPSVKEDKETSKEAGEDELDSYTKGVQKRIKKLNDKYRQEQNDKQEAINLSQKLIEENKKLQQRVKTLDTGYVSEYGGRLQAQSEQAKRMYTEAYEAGDANKMAEAQQAMAQIAVEQQNYNTAKLRVEQQAKSKAQTQAQNAQVQQQPQQQQPRPKPDARAEQWASQNDWFGKDKIMTTAAFTIHNELVNEEGFDANTEEYYNAVDSRIRNEFPHKFQTAKKSGGNQVAAAGNSASRNKTGRRTVKLSPSQIAIAKKLGVPLEEYAKYVKE